MYKFTRIPADTFKKLQLNAGIFASVFEPSTGTLEESSLIGATSGGATFEATPEFSDFGDDIDNCPKNMKELKKLDSWEAKMSGSYVTMDTALARSMVGAADITSDDESKVVPRNMLKDSDFKDVWWIGDYSDVNEDSGSNESAGFIAIRLMDALSTGGFKITSGDKSKGTFDFEYTGHYSMKSMDTPPFELYIKMGTVTE